MAKVFKAGKYSFYLREEMSWKIYRESQKVLAREFGEIRANIGKKELEKAEAKFSLDLEQKVEDYYVIRLIKSVKTEENEEYNSFDDIQKIVDDLNADEFKPIFDYCKSLYNATTERMQNAKKKM